MFVHAGGLGDPVKLAGVVRAAWEAVGAQVEAEGKETKDDKLVGIDPQRLAQELGGTPKILDGVADISVPRTEDVTLTLKSETVAIEPEMGPESDLDFQPLGNNRAVVIGELCVTADEAPAVMQSLRQSRIEVDALHNHFLTEQPRLFFMHLQAAGDADDLARAIRQALDLTHSAR
jgi:hypothetical protein